MEKNKNSKNVDRGINVPNTYNPTQLITTYQS